MKNIFKQIGAVIAIAMIAAIGFSMTACNDGSGGGGQTTGGGSNANVVGTWTGTYTEKVSGFNMTTNMTYVFKADGSLSVTTETMGIPMSASGTYTVQGNTVIMTNTDGVTDRATVSGNTMTIPIRSGINGPQIDTATLRKTS